ncbi:MAG: cysteine desulfurase [Lachnospiraceae bacterium]|nr:cysteine desulfurase [Lachnospiraceae bacterium]
MNEIYLDNSATTKPFDDVINTMSRIALDDYGNPSSRHNKGMDAEDHVKKSKDLIAGLLKAKPDEIIFTSGGTESDNTALIGAAMAGRRRGNHIITTSIEHPAILETTKYLEKQGFDITYLPVDEYGIVNTDALKDALRPETLVVSVMHTNNEIGSVQPVEEIGRIVKAYNKDILFHVDAVQGFGKYRIIPKKLNIDMMSVSGHKIHGPKGIGFLYVREGVRILPYMLGGGQQKGMRSGTENVPAIAGLALASEKIYDNLDTERQRLYDMKEYLISNLKDIDDTRINGINLSNDSLHEAVLNTCPHIVSFSVKSIRAEVLLNELASRGIYISSGSACASNKSKAGVSDTLSAIKLPKEYDESTIRISMSVFTTVEEVETFVREIKEIIPDLRKYTRR